MKPAIIWEEDAKFKCHIVGQIHSIRLQMYYYYLYILHLQSKRLVFICDYLAIESLLALSFGSANYRRNIVFNYLVVMSLAEQVMCSGFAVDSWETSLFIVTKKVFLCLLPYKTETIQPPVSKVSKYKKKIWPSSNITVSGFLCVLWCIALTTVLLQPASKNRRERTELKPDYFDPSSIMDDSVRIFHFFY